MEGYRRPERSLRIQAPGALLADEKVGAVWTKDPATREVKVPMNVPQSLQSRQAGGAHQQHGGEDQESNLKGLS